MIVECWHCFLIDIVMSDGRSSDAGGRGVVERRWQEKLQNWKEEVVRGAFGRGENNTNCFNVGGIGRGVTAGPLHQKCNQLVTVQCPRAALYCRLSKDRENM